jgi:hypothetical protein
MSTKADVGFQVVDRRHGQSSGEDSRRHVPSDRRAHSVLLAYYSEEGARAYLEDAALHPGQVEELMRQRERALAYLQGLPPLEDRESAVEIEDAASLKEIDRVMSRPECKGAYPRGSWEPKLVEIEHLVPVHPSLDVAYAETLGDASLNAQKLLAQVKLCFAEKHPADFQVSVDQSHKAVNIQSINPSLEVIGLRYEQMEGDGPLVVSFMVGPPPNIVVVAHYGNRYFLSTGYHRVYRLLKAGIKHVPCAVRKVPSLGKVGTYGSAVFSEAILTAPRPPLFTDFADSALGVIVPLRPMQKVVRIRPDEHFVFG